ncbi:MAG: tRNA glutamyl-Q(34) synthetase GluQRS [Litoreibacter sp.]
MRTRFAPSPTGPLHLGHVFSAITAAQLAEKHEGTFLLRIEDIDTTRARYHWETQIYDDLKWLGLSWPEPTLRQSDHMNRYSAALDFLWDEGLLYPCACNRRDIRGAITPLTDGTLPSGPDGLIYPGTCRDKARPRSRPSNTTLRLNMNAALERCRSLNFTEIGTLTKQRTIDLDADGILKATGDIVIARKDIGTSYHLSVVLDDAFQDITHVVRGFDLFDATQIHVVLQEVLELLRPTYLHHQLVTDDAGKRLAKRDDARAISLYREEGLSPQDVRALVF